MLALLVHTNTRILAGAVASGQVFIDAVNKIVKGGNKDQIAILLAAGVIDAKNQPVEAKPL